MDERRFRRAEQALWDACGRQPVEQSYRLERTAATVRVQEIGLGSPVVFVHGASTAGASWIPLASRLDGVRCILIDRPGCGLSPRLPVPLADLAALDRFADALVVDVCDALSVATVHVVATSFGGYIGLRSVAANPDRISGLVVLGWSFGAPVVATPLVMRVATHPALGRLMLRVPPTDRVVRSILKRVGLRGALERGRFGDLEVGWFRSLLRDTDTMRNEIDTLPRLMTLRGFDDRTLLEPSLLAAIDTPVLFLWGEDDPMGGAAIARSFAGHLPAAALEVIPEAGHAPWIDEPDLVAERVRTFVSATEAGGGGPLSASR